jgi:hypothetical protein
MRKICLGVSIIALSGACATAQASQQAGVIAIFDGISLTNWEVDDPQYADHFSVKDGLLRVEGDGGWLRSEKQYGDFILRLKFRYLTEDPDSGRVGVSGVFLRTPASSTYGQGWPDNSFEVQLANRQGGRPAIPGDARWGGAVLRHGNVGGPTTFDTQAALLSYRQTGEWQEMEIQAVGDAIHVTLNGRYLGAASSGGNLEGYIGLQAETGGIEFQSVEIYEGSPATTSPDDGFVPLFDGETFAGWRLQNPESRGFEIKDGAIVVHGRGTGAEPAAGFCNGSLWSEKSYEDFIVRFQARFQTNASVGGFFLRSAEPGSGLGGGEWNQVEVRGMEDRLLPWNGVLMRSASAAQGPTMLDFRAAEVAFAAVDDWTTDWLNYEARAEGGRITTWVNGVLLSQADNVEPLSGLFGFQCERETVEYRNIEIKELQ